MSFDDPERHRRLQDQSPFTTGTTIEIARSASRSGIVVHMEHVTSAQQARMILAQAFELAPRRILRPTDVTMPGWWAIIVGWAALQHGTAAVQRGAPCAAPRHVMLTCGDARTTIRPDWPMARFSPRSPWADLRGERALALGPSDTEIEMYRAAANVHADPAEIARMFEMGVLEWIPGEPRGRRRGIRAAGS